MNLARLQHAVGLALVLVSISTYCLADGNLVLFILGVPGAVGAWFLTAPPLGRPLPRLAINLLLLGILLYALQRMVLLGFNVSNVCEIIVLTLLVKILDRRSQRDWGQIASICTFLGIGTILTSNAFGVGILLILCVVLLIAATLLHQIALPTVAADAPPPSHAASGPRSGRHLRRLVGGIALSAMLISISIFLFTPRRLGAGLFGDWGNPAVGQVSGFSDEVELGTPGFISPSPAAVFDFEIFDREGNSLGANGLVYYLRGAVLDQYERGRWTRSNQFRERDRTRRVDRNTGPIQVGGSPITWTTLQRITVRNIAPGRSYLFSLWRPVSIEVSQPSTVTPYHEDGTLIRDGDAGKLEYIVRSREPDPIFTFEDFGRRNLVEPIEAPYLDFDRFRQLATQILTNAGLEPDPAQRPPEQFDRAAEAIARYFDAGFVYTLESEVVPRRRDPTQWFLFEHKAGHCEYYASAMAVLCRSVGLNARVITGYVATEFNEPTSHYVVRQSNAHAWVEVEIAPGAWKTYDPTPPADFQRVHEPSNSLFARARRAFDAAEFAWIRAVVSFDADRQQSFMQSVFKADWRPDAAVEDFVRRSRNADPKAVFVILASAAGAAAIAFACIYLLWRFRATLLGGLARWLDDLWLSITPARDARAVYRRLLRELRRQGRPKPAHVPLLTHVQAVAPGLTPNQAHAAERLARALYDARFGSAGGRLSPDLLRDLRMLRTSRGR